MVDEKKVDEGWKQQARAEKERLAKEPTASASAGASADEEEGMAEPDFNTFVASMAAQTLMALGQMEHPATRKKEVNIPHAKYTIDILTMLKEKTKGNLTPEEAQSLEQTLYNLQMLFVKVQTKKT
ncbi:MAG: DUF1844 domain-containing protein [Planctomycetes bacterium]|nr:DUF1844 domain-containing protein [Planctomycetota bacterium]